MTQKNLKLDKETKDFAIVLRNVVSEEICKFASTEFKMLETCVGLMHPENAGKEIGLTESFSIYSPLFTETLSLLIQPIVEEAVGKKLFPTYSYGRIYKNGAILSPHLDRMSSEYTISLCLQPDPAHDWQLVIKHLNNTQKCVSLGIGDILIYPGRDLNHWRQGAFKGTEQIQAFIQYVDAAGTSKGLKWDDRPAMGMPWESASNLVHENLDTMLKTLKSAESDDHLSEILPTVGSLPTILQLTTGTNNES